jgi:hypothetical protein
MTKTADSQGLADEWSRKTADMKEKMQFATGER